MVPEDVEVEVSPEHEMMRKERYKRHKEAPLAIIRECNWNIE